jgi:hypothetical protein
VSDETAAAAATPIRLKRRWAALALIGAGIPGLLSLLPVLPAVEGVPTWVLLVNPGLLLVVFAGLGALAAPQVGFTSRIALRASGVKLGILPANALMLLAAGAAAGLAVALADHATRGLWQHAAATPPSLAEAWAPASLLLGICYGGIVEEITMRWGVMSLAVLAIWSIIARAQDRPPRAAIAVGILVAALVFAAGHLPSLSAAGIPLDPALVARTIGWNALLGIGFGVLFATRDLESAMGAHAGFHVGVAVAALVT